MNAGRVALTTIGAGSRPGGTGGRGPGDARSARPGSAIRSSRWPATAATTSGTTGCALAYDPTTQRARRDGASSARAPTQDAVALRPRPARLRRRRGARSTAAPPAWRATARSCRSPRPGRCRRRARSPCSSAYSGMPAGRHRPGRLDRGLGPDGRRRLRRRRAAGRAGLVPGQRQPARQGDVRHRVTVPDGVTAMSNGVLASSSPATGTHDMVLARGRSRWRRTWRRRPSGRSP